MSLDFSPELQGVSLVEVAQDALDEANRRRDVALEAIADFALRALLAGEDIERIMDACHFQVETKPEGDVEGYLAHAMVQSFFGTPAAVSRRQRFAAWLAEAVADRVRKAPAEAVERGEA